MSSKKNQTTWLIMLVLFLVIDCTIAWGEIIYVDVNTPNNNDGSNWAKAYKYLQDALADAKYNADPCDQIWVAEGTYRPDVDTNDPCGGDRTDTFQLINGVFIYGGFSGNETTLDKRDWQVHETILSGDIGAIDVNTDNSYHVVTGSVTGPNAVIDGFTITAGCAYGPFGDANDGAGLFNNQGSPIVANCTFINNDASRDGGGILNKEGGSPTVTNCVFTGNRASMYGGGMANWNGSGPKVTKCTFIDNEAGWSGGAMTNFTNCDSSVKDCMFSGNQASSGGGITNIDSNITLTSCTLSNNTASGEILPKRGGGIYNISCNPTLAICSFNGNSANEGGGMFNYNNSSPTVTNCTFSGNTATSDGGGILNYENSSSTITNCILWGDTAASDGNEIALYTSSTIDVNYCNIKGEQTDIGKDGTSTINWGVGNIGDDPCFFDADNPNPNLRDYHLRPVSPCIDAGDNDSVPVDMADLDNDGNTTEPIPFDIDGDIRVVDGDSNGTAIVDMGSDEVIWDGATVSPASSATLNPGGGPNDPNVEAMVVFDNNSFGNADVTIVEMSNDPHPPVGGFEGLGTTVRIETTLADGEFLMKVMIPLDEVKLGSTNPCKVQLRYYDSSKGWLLAVAKNTQNSPGYFGPVGDSFCVVSTVVPTLSNDLGDYGVYWNPVTKIGFVWANVDHTTDFSAVTYDIRGDFEPDWDVDFADFAYFAGWWLQTSCGSCGDADITGNGTVNWSDLREFADNWLAGVED